MTILSNRDPSRWRALPGQVAEETPEESAVLRQLERVGHSVKTALGPIVIVDFLLGSTIMFVAESYVGGIPSGIFMGLAMFCIGMCRRATLKVRNGGLLALTFLGLCAFLAVESHAHHMPASQRLTKFAILFLAAAMLAAGRVNIRSFVVGTMCGLLLNAALFYAGLTTNYYPPYLTGFFGDKNISGMYYALFGILGLLVVPKMLEVPWVVVSMGLLFLTGSRTSLGGFLLALGWILLRNRIGIVFRIVLVAVGWLILRYAVERFAESSAFGNRQGDDWYRAQVEAAMWWKVRHTSWEGGGLNQGYVLVGGIRREWFHNSYLQAFAEGGWVFLILTLVAFVVLGLGLFDRRTVISSNMLRAEGAIVVVLVCAWKLGEVFMTFGGFVALGIVLAYRFGEPITESDLAWVIDDHRSRTRHTAWDDILKEAKVQDAGNSLIDPADERETHAVRGRTPRLDREKHERHAYMTGPR